MDLYCSRETKRLEDKEMDGKRAKVRGKGAVEGCLKSWK